MAFAACGENALEEQRQNCSENALEEQRQDYSEEALKEQRQDCGENALEEQRQDCGEEALEGKRQDCSENLLSFLIFRLWGGILCMIIGSGVYIISLSGKMPLVRFFRLFPALPKALLSQEALSVKLLKGISVIFLIFARACRYCSM